MKKFICVLAVLATVLCLSSCGRQWYEDGDKYFKISFPSDMSVIDLRTVTEDDPALEQSVLDFEELSEFKDDQGGLFFAQSENGDRSCSVAVFGSNTTINIWELKKSDSDTVIDVYKQLASNFNSNGYSVVGKTEVDQGKGHYIFIELSTKADGVTDMLFMTTVKNGLQYSVSYTADEMTDQNRREAEKIFDSAFITRSISQNDSSEARKGTLRTILVVIIIMIAAAAVFAVVKAKREKIAERDSKKYKSQFGDDLK